MATITYPFSKWNESEGNFGFVYLDGSDEVTMEVVEEWSDCESIEEFEQSDYYYAWQDSLMPMSDCLHILEYPYSKDELLHKYTPLPIVEIKELDAQGIVQLGCGSDNSSLLELTYYLLDGVSPINPSGGDHMSSDCFLSESSLKILDFCRGNIRVRKPLFPENIKNFIQENIENKPLVN